MPVGFSTPIPLTYMRTSIDSEKDLFFDANNRIKIAVNDGNLSELHRILTWVRVMSQTVFNHYIEEGSCYPALTLAMTKGDFQKVLNALDIIKSFSEFMTPTIRLCHAACLLELGHEAECLAMMIKCDEDFTVPDLLNELIKSTRVYEKAAFVNLRDEALPHLPKT